MVQSPLPCARSFPLWGSWQSHAPEGKPGPAPALRSVIERHRNRPVTTCAIRFAPAARFLAPPQKPLLTKDRGRLLAPVWPHYGFDLARTPRATPAHPSIEYQNTTRHTPSPHSHSKVDAGFSKQLEYAQSQHPRRSWKEVQYEVARNIRRRALGLRQ